MLAATSAWAQRLPPGVVPSHYDITVAPDLAAAKFTGEETIQVRVAAPTTAIVLNAAEIVFRDVTVSAAGRTQRATVTLDEKAEQATIAVGEPIPAGEAEIVIRYDGLLNDDLRGFYLSKANNRRYAVTQLEATDARRMFPSFDEPALKATFALTAIIDAKDHAISNGAVISDTPGPGAGRHTIKFDTTPKMSTYLVALAVGDFECVEGDADDIPVRICATPDKKQLTGLALESTKEILAYFNRYYAIRYPFKKLDVVAVPDFAAGAMENTAAIFYREALLLAEPDAPVSVRKTIAKVLAHEIAHQWFGNVVTMEWWDDIWLNEGFANWAMSKPVKEWRRDWHVDLDEVGENHTAMNLDALRSTRPIRAKASTPAEISELFDPIAYEKGAAVVRMLEAWIGEEDFRRAVNLYIQKFQYGNARAEDFWGTLTEATRKPVDAVMSSFVDQPGLPLVTFDIRCGGAGAGKAGRRSAVSIVATQERYLRDAAPAAPSNQVWQIPVCVRLDSGATTCEVLSRRRQTITLDPGRREGAAGGSCPAWIMGNAGGRGYYRTAVAPAAVRAMAARIADLTPAERKVALSDELALVRARRHDVGTLLDLAAGFGAERSASVVETLRSVLAAVDQEFTSAATRPAYRAWVSRLASPALAEVGMSARPSESDEAKALRAVVVVILAFTARDPKVLGEARRLIERELDKPGTVEPTLRAVLIDAAALAGDAALYDRYLARSKAATDPDEHYQYLYALTAFSDPALVRRTMELTVSPEVRSQDAKLVVARMLSGDGRVLAWRLVRDRWAEIQKKTGEFVGNTIIVGALGSFCEAGAAAEIRTFFSRHKVPDAERTLQQALERVSSCAREAPLRRRALAAWLSRRGLKRVA